MPKDYSLRRTVEPIREPVTVPEAKKQLELLASDNTHDAHLKRLISSAREQVEHDTETALITSTWLLSRHRFPDHEESICIPMRPIQSVSSVTYYDANNQQQTLSPDVYGLDVTRSLLYLKYDQEWPDITEQHDGIAVTFVAGFGENATDVDDDFRHMVLIQTELWFEQRGVLEDDKIHNKVYDRMVRRKLRASYP